MIRLQNAEHRYNAQTLVSLPEIDLNTGESLLILGQSGSGKSTLLNVLGGLLKPTSGVLTIGDTELYSLTESARDAFRGRYIGIIFQTNHLVDSLSVRDNLRLAQYLSGMTQDDSKIDTVLSDLDIKEKKNSGVNELSEGQKQRVGIARAVINEPKVILADEPTSSLDDIRCEQVVQLLKKQASAHNATLIVSTHDQRVKNHFENLINLDQLTISAQ
jgi:putative ABC transport system ATP-binding protein